MLNITEIFKAYDIRGIYPSDLDEDKAYNIGRAFVKFLETKQVVVGRDQRHSSPQLFKALTKGITGQGADVIDIGICSTPMFYFGSFDADSSIMITASHNPKQYNGFKLCKNNAIPISEDSGIKEIKALVDKNTFEDPISKGKITKKDILEDFIAFNKSFIKTDKSFKIVLDAANGMSGYTLPKIFSKLDNIELIELYTDIDFSFPNHEANPLKEETLKHLSKEIIKTGSDFGIATDGDGDRCVFVDEKGDPIRSDILSALISESILLDNPNSTILYDLRSSKIVKETIKKNSGTPSICRVGHSFIKRQMRKQDAIFAGELSGHLYFKEHNFTESSFIAISYIINLLSKRQKPLSELIQPLKVYYHSGEINNVVKDKDSMLKYMEEHYKNISKDILHLDGLSIYFDDWWFNLRKSNTEPLLRLNLEADTKELMQTKVNEVLDLIRLS